VRMLRHLCNVYGCTSYGRKPDHGPEDCSWCEAEALLDARSRPAPPADAAREAVRYWTFQTEWGDGYRPAAVLFQTERIASLVREQNVRLELNVGPVIAVDVPLAALSSPAPAPSAKETK